MFISEHSSLSCGVKIAGNAACIPLLNCKRNTGRSAKILKKRIMIWLITKLVGLRPNHLKLFPVCQGRPVAASGSHFFGGIGRGSGERGRRAKR